MVLVLFVVKLVHITGVLGHLMVNIRQMDILELVDIVENLKQITIVGVQELLVMIVLFVV